MNDWLQREGERLEQAKLAAIAKDQIAAELYEKLQQSFSKTEDMKHIKSAIEKATKPLRDAIEIYGGRQDKVAVEALSRAAHASIDTSKLPPLKRGSEDYSAAHASEPRKATPRGGQGAEQLARTFHETYERLAPNFGYETRKETRQFEPNTPNGRLMIAVCAELLSQRPTATDDTKRLDWLNNEALGASVNATLDDLLGSKKWTSLRSAIDAAMSQRKEKE